MLGRLVLILLQLVAGWFLAPMIARHVPIGGDPKIFVMAVLFAIIVWIVGLIGAEVLKDVGRPSSTALAWALVLSLIGAALIVFLPSLIAQIPLKFDRLLVPLVGAVLGYTFKR
ncbi:MAG: hypothetical protein KDJ41_08785 [Hyphomicrobiaceae bacterium]|nr:hypothetical protein [Hyphomicrobiaceae bacterium]